MTTHPSPIVCRGVRGATTVENNEREEILAATRELLYIMIRANGIQQEDVACGYFTLTDDLNAVFPALAGRQLGWYEAALICAREVPVPGSLPRCVRIMIHWNTRKKQNEINHVYLRQAKHLRPDRVKIPPIPLAEIEAAIQGNIEDLVW